MLFVVVRPDMPVGHTDQVRLTAGVQLFHKLLVGSNHCRLFLVQLCQIRAILQRLQQLGKHGLLCRLKPLIQFFTQINDPLQLIKPGFILVRQQGNLLQNGKAHLVGFLYNGIEHPVGSRYQLACPLLLQLLIGIPLLINITLLDNLVPGFLFLLAGLFQQVFKPFNTVIPGTVRLHQAMDHGYAHMGTLQVKVYNGPPDQVTLRVMVAQA